MENRKIILIGGAPTTGKSTIAEALAAHLQLPWISTDQIRSMLQAVGDKNAHPALFNSAGYDAERFLTELSAKQIVDMEFEQGEATWLGVRTLVNNPNSTWKKGGIIEGVGILPKMVARDCNTPDVTAIFLVDHDKNRIRETVFARGLWDDAHTYGDHLKEKEVEWAALYGQRLEEEATKLNFPLVAVKKNSDDLQRILRVIG